LKRGRSSYLASFRMSLIDRISPIIAGTDIAVNFSDLFLKLYRTDRENSRCSTTLIRTSDRGRTGAAEEFSWTNFVLGGRCLTFPITSRFLFDGTVGVSYTGNRVGSPDRPDRSSDIIDVRVDLGFTYPLERTTIRWGAFSQAQWTNYSLGGQFQDLDRDSDAVILAGGYGDAELKWPQFSVTPGVALVLHPFLFAPSLEPRLRFSWSPSTLSGGGISGATGIYRQSLSGITDERDAGSLFVAWMPPPLDSRQTTSFHWLLGWEQPIAAWLRSSIEGYYKHITHLQVPIWSTIARFTTTLQPADGTSYGFDARLEAEAGQAYLMAGYAYSSTEYRSRQE